MKKIHDVESRKDVLQIPNKRGEAYAQKYGPRFCEISDKTASNVKEVSIGRTKKRVKASPRRDLRIMRPRA